MIRRLTVPFLLLFALAALILPAAPTHAEITSEQGKSFVDNIAEKGINEVIAAEVSQAEKTQRFRDMFLSTFDTASTARFVLGRHWRASDPVERERFTELFQEYNVLIWARRFDEYNGQELIVTGTRPDGDKGLFVESQIIGVEGGEPINIVWRLRERNGEPKVVDIVIEGVSMALTYRSEYDSIVSRSGLSALNDQLAQKIEQLKNT